MRVTVWKRECSDNDWDKRQRAAAFMAALETALLKWGLCVRLVARHPVPLALYLGLGL